MRRRSVDVGGLSYAMTNPGVLGYGWGGWEEREDEGEEGGVRSFLAFLSLSLSFFGWF
jgi:hypothetical protein